MREARVEPDAGPRTGQKRCDLCERHGRGNDDTVHSRRDALRGCLKKLPENDRHLVDRCYGDSRQSFKTAAEELGRPINTVYKALNRIRRAL